MFPAFDFLLSDVSLAVKPFLIIVPCFLALPCASGTVLDVFFFINYPVFFCLFCTWLEFSSSQWRVAPMVVLSLLLLQSLLRFTLYFLLFKLTLGL